MAERREKVIIIFSLIVEQETLIAHPHTPSSLYLS